MLILDDLHWSDGASLELIAALARRAPAAPVLLALGFRPGPAAQRLAGPAHRRRRVTRLELAQLDPDEAGELLGGLDPAAVAAIYSHGGGNPFYLEQLGARRAGRRPCRFPRPGRGQRWRAAGRGGRHRRGAGRAGRRPARGSWRPRPWPASRSSRTWLQRSPTADCPGPRRARRPARPGPRPSHPGAAPVHLPPPARAAGRVRLLTRRMAARGACARRGAARRAGGAAQRARSPRGAVGGAGRRGGDRAAAGGGEVRSRPRSGGRGRAGSRRRCACCRAATPIGRCRCGWRWPQRCGRWASSSAAARPCSRPSTCSRPTPSFAGWS